MVDTLIRHIIVVLIIWQVVCIVRILRHRSVFGDIVTEQVCDRVRIRPPRVDI
jgi:hypothetical protein